MKKKIYIAGPYSSAPVSNTVRAVVCAEDLAKRGFAPYVPHLSFLWDAVYAHPYQFWIDHDNEFLPICDAVLRIPGESSGADAEMELAHTLGIPVFSNIDAIAEFFKAWHKAKAARRKKPTFTNIPERPFFTAPIACEHKWGVWTDGARCCYNGTYGREQFRVCGKCKRCEHRFQTGEEAYSR